jgi:hypothetical protein
VPLGIVRGARLAGEERRQDGQDGLAGIRTPDDAQRGFRPPASRFPPLEDLAEIGAGALVGLVLVGSLSSGGKSVRNRQEMEIPSMEVSIKNRLAAERRVGRRSSGEIARTSITADRGFFVFPSR